MAYPSITYTFANSTTADATQVNQDFTDIINGLSDGTKDLSINAITCAGAATLNGNVTLGNSSSDDLTVTASLASSIALKTTYSYDIGAATLGLRALYLGSDDSAANTLKLKAGTLGAGYTLTFPTSGGTVGQFPVTNGSGTLSFRYPDKTTSKTADYTATGDESVIICDATGAAFTVTLPAAVSYTGKRYVIKKTDSSTNAVTIDGNASETIDGTTTTTLNTQYESIEIVCDGSNWHIIDRKIPTILTSFSPTLSTGSFGTNTNKFSWSRIGRFMRIIGQVNQSGAGTAGTGNYLITIPLSATVDTTYVSVNTSSIYSSLGTASIAGTTVANSIGSVFASSSTQIGIAYVNATNNATVWSSSTQPLSDSTVIVAFEAMIPISGWNG